MEQALIQVAIQVPAILVIGYVFLRVLEMVMDERKTTLEKLISAIDSLKETLRTVIK